MAVGVARSFASLHPRIPFDDLLGAAELGLVQAARSFTADEGVAFSTFAYCRVTGSIRDALRGEAKWFAIRRAAEAAAVAVMASLNDDGDPLHDEPSATRAQHSEKAAVIQGAFLAALAAADPPQGGPERSAEEAALLRTIAAVREIVANLPERDRIVVQRHYYEDDELKSVAELLGVSYTTARRIHQDALARIAKRLKARGLNAD